MVKIETNAEDPIDQDNQNYLDKDKEATNLMKTQLESDPAQNKRPPKKIKLEDYSEQMEGMTAEQKKFVQALLEENLKLSQQLKDIHRYSTRALSRHRSWLVEKDQKESSKMNSIINN